MDSAKRTEKVGKCERVLVAVCTYNESLNLPSLIERIQSSLPQADVLVVDDDSPDGTGQWALEEAETNRAIRVIIRRDERGLGGALREAIRYATEGDYDWLLNLDADHSHAPEDLPRLLSTATENVQDGHAQHLDCVVGTRYAPGGSIQGWTLHRKLMSRAVNAFATMVLNLPVSDCSGSLRCYKVATLCSIQPETLRSRGYAIFEEILLRLRRNDAKFGEVPITFHERHRGESKLTFAEALGAALQILRLAFVQA